MPSDPESPPIDPRIFQTAIVDPALQESQEPHKPQTREAHDNPRFAPEEEAVCILNTT